MHDLTLLTIIFAPSSCALIYLHLNGSERGQGQERESRFAWENNVNYSDSFFFGLLASSIMIWREYIELMPVLKAHSTFFPWRNNVESSLFISISE
jgi:hypothetical protein